MSTEQSKLLKEFWIKQKQKISALKITEREEFKNLTDLPLARIKRIMKADDDVRMIRAEAPVLFAKACELFILELTLRSYHFTEAKDRNNITKEDVQFMVNTNNSFDFLIEILREREEGLRKKMEAKTGTSSDVKHLATQSSLTSISKSSTIPSSIGVE